jgi:hypothetical protein
MEKGRQESSDLFLVNAISALAGQAAVARETG